MSGYSPNPSTSGACNWRGDFVPEEIWINEEEDNTMPFPDKAESKDTEMGLYDELFESDIKRSREKTQVSSDYEDLQKQVLRLKSLVAEKDSKLTTMTQHYTNVKKNICSLYKTAKIEIDHKDSLLAEANSRLDEILFQRNMTVDQLEKQNPSANHNKSFKSNEDVTDREKPTESDGPSKSVLDSDKKTTDQSSAKRKRPSSPTTPTSSDNKSAKPENSFQNKKQNCESKNASKSTNSVIQDNLNNKQNVSKSNSSKTIKTGDAKASQDIKPSDESSSKRNCDLNGELASGINQEPSIVEVFAQMQELAFKDPAATNAIFFNLLPAELRDSFLEFEKTQVNALNKLKQSFVSCYFSQCSAGTSVEGSEKEPQSSTAFFFPDNSSQPKTESCTRSSAAVDSSDSKSKSQENVSEVKKDSDLQKSGKRSTSTISFNSSDSKSEPQEILSVETEVIKDSDLQKSGNRSTSTLNFNCSDAKSKPQEILSGETEVIKDSDLQKSTRKSTKRHKSPKKAVKLYKYKDDNLTLYTQRQLNRR